MVSTQAISKLEMQMG
jgi:hypothetical protein